MTEVAQVDTMNKALFQLGQEPVSDLSDASLEGSNAAAKLMRVMDAAKATVLRRHGWLCALTYTTLPLATIPGYANWKFPAVYYQPAGTLRVWEIEGHQCDAHGRWPHWQAGSVDTDIGARDIIMGRHTADVIKVALVRSCAWGALDAHVADAVAYELAARGAYSVTGDNALATKLETKAEAKALLAISVDGTQEEGAEPLAPSIPALLRHFGR